MVTGDEAVGESDPAPYDKVIITVGRWALPPPWFDQLAPDGVLVVPLHWRGRARSVAFVRHDTHLRAENSRNTDQNIVPPRWLRCSPDLRPPWWSNAAVVANQRFDHI
ncbi:hypothetical protein [Streptoalloteichus hindustanus]|uniref:Protein-L-isoaspartate(D-aspartate) O-methyltransferase (PCMT) n=1 Tax=Streptoalloteichus hindustanus TaxID=2017 RepID=A0A1M5Q1Z5_STRHI|nr:hypothetical protein [Streptoalloteichus hindustanus]SHH07970.1 Protein-L-isoaspartate(D-aspartate) O-methyltransferase (PCMT) [Streptoalloteichus hindustanus]